ncbi:MAG: class I SAM-dependent methyltransferase [Thiotrichales bacterium]|nr:class I SAM-dependent methyltransferase [Thiotrichales bacterium]
MLKTLSQSKVSWLERLVHPTLIKKFVLNLPFKHIQKGSITLTLYGESYRFEGPEAGRHAELNLLNPLRTYWLLKTQGELGFAQAYFEHAVDTHSLYQLMHLAIENQSVFKQLLSNKALNLWQLWQHRSRHNSVQNSRKNISYHYDLGNDFYSRWLDKTMSYSSGIFAFPNQDLASAQHHKYARLLDCLDVQPNDHLLEIGCGWGGLMEAALDRGAQIKGLTLSEEQQKYAQKRLESHAAKDVFEVALQDYRHETAQYDHIVSIEMFEAVGKEYWHSYFEQLQNCLKPHGKVALQIITIDESIAESYQADVDFIQTYIFPGGLLPSLTQLKNLATLHGFWVEDVFAFGQDYAKTCQLWKHDFNQHSELLQNMGFDRKFQKMWNYYLDYCSVGFETGQISVHQLILSKIPHH